MRKYNEHTVFGTVSHLHMVLRVNKLQRKLMLNIVVHCKFPNKHI